MAASRENLTKFPRYLKSNFGAEASDFSFQKAEDANFFNKVFEFNQFIEQLDALAYAEAHFLPRDISKLNVTDLLNFAKNINRIAARSLSLGKQFYHPAGEFSALQMCTLQETGIPDVDFEHGEEFSEHNYQILKMTHGEKVATDYKNFFPLRLEKMMQKARELSAILSPDYAIRYAGRVYKQLGLDKTDELKAYQLVNGMRMDPDEIEPSMQKTYAIFLSMIKENKNPLECAAYLLYRHATVHPFVFANKRSARIIVNTLLMMLGCRPLIIPREISAAVQESTDQNLLPVIKLLKIAQSSTSALAYDILFNDTIIPNVPFLLSLCEREFEDVTLVRFKHAYHLLPVQVSDAYALEQYPAFRFFTGINGAEVVSPFFEEKRKKYNAIVVNGDVCFAHAKRLQQINPQVAYYLAHCALDFFENDKSHVEEAKLCRHLIDKISSNIQSISGSVKKDKEPHIVVKHSNTKKVQGYVSELKELLGSSIVKSYSNQLMFSASWSKQLKREAAISLAEELQLSEEDQRKLIVPWMQGKR